MRNVSQRSITIIHIRQASRSHGQPLSGYHSAPGPVGHHKAKPKKKHRKHKRHRRTKRH